MMKFLFFIILFFQWIFVFPCDAQIFQGEEKEKRVVSVYFVLPKDKVAYYKEGRELSCGDYLVPIQIEINTYPQHMLMETLRHLFAAKNETLAKLEDPASLTNPLKRSRLLVHSVKIPQYNTILDLKGSMVYHGECELEAMKAQIESTVFQFDAGAEIWLNGKGENFYCLGKMPSTCYQNYGIIDLTSPEVLNNPAIVDYNPHVTIY